MPSGLLRGLLAGAAGTTALNAATYADMVARGRPASSSPQDLVERTADRAGVDIPGDGDERDNRLEGLGPLSGTLVGVGVGGVTGIVHRFLAKRGRHVPAVVAIPLIAVAAMALSDVPLKLLDISDPADWAATDWAADALPHLVYATVTYVSLHARDLG